MSWQFGVADDIGGRSEQQDRCAVLHTPDGSTHLAIVADGVGGHGDGSQAAQAVLDVAARMIVEPIDDAEHFLRELCQNAHRAILNLERAASGASCSTCVLLLLRAREAWWAHVGDSRLYFVRGGRALQLTTDHSVAQLHKDAGTTPPGGVQLNQIYMSLGGSGRITPDADARSMQPGEGFLLCSDGFWGPMGADQLAEALSTRSLDDALAAEWVLRARDAGGAGGDNISLVLARWTEPPQGVLARLRSWLREWLPNAAPRAPD